MRRIGANTISSMVSRGTCTTHCQTLRSSGFTGTPIEKTDANTRAVFGDYIAIYDIQRAVTDGSGAPAERRSNACRCWPPRRTMSSGSNAARSV